MNKKMFYEAPDAELIELKNEGYLLASFDNDNNTETITSDGDEDL